MDKKDLLYRFIFGGSAVVLSYVATKLLPWKIIGGIFAAFPAVMVVAVMMVGIKSGTKEAVKTAQGSVFGMIGCAFCVVAVLICLQWTNNWFMSLSMGLMTWFISSILLVFLKEKWSKKHHASY